MADKQYDISIKTKADIGAIKQTDDALENLEKQIDQTDEANQDLAKPVSLAVLRSEVAKLTQELENAEIGSAKFEQAKRGLTTASQALHAAESQVGGATRNGAMATLEFSRALEDAQYGVRGVLNNIPGLVASLGGGAGLAGVASIAAVGLSVLVEWFGSMGESAEEQQKRLDGLSKTYGMLMKAVDELAQRRADQYFAAMATSQEATAIATDATTEAMHRQIAAMRAELGASQALQEATRARIESEIELRRAVDPNFDEAAAVTQRVALEQEKLAAEIAAANQEREVRLAENQIKDATAQQAYEARLAELDLLKKELAKAREEYAALEAFRLPPALREPDARTSREKEISDIGIPFSQNEKNRQDQLYKEIAQIDVASNSPEAARAEEMELKISQLEKQISSNERGIGNAFQSLIATLSANEDERAALVAEADAVASSFSEKAAGLANKSALETLKAASKDLLEETTQLQTAVEQLDPSAASGKVAEVKALVQQINEAQADGILTAQELQDIQAKQRELNASLSGMGAEVTAQLQELEKSFTAASTAQKEATAMLANAVKDNAVGVVEVQATQAVVIQGLNTKIQTIQSQMNQLLSR